MAVISTHTLNSVDGTHAAGINIELFLIEKSGIRTKLLQSQTDEGGRLSTEVDLEETDKDAKFELVFHTGEYFSTQNISAGNLSIIPEIVVRFVMPDHDACYHIPLMLSPHSYSLWSSGLSLNQQ